MFWGIVVILLVGFVMYRWGKSSGASSAQEEIKKQRLMRKIEQRKAAGSEAQTPGPVKGKTVAGERPVQAAAHSSEAHPGSYGRPGNYRHAVAAGVLGAVAGAALMHGHDGIQDRVNQMTGGQQSGNDLSEDTFQDDSYDAGDNVDSDETQDDADTAYDADESIDGAADDADDDSDYDSYFDSDSGSDDGGSFFDDGGSSFDDNDDGFF